MNPIKKALLQFKFEYRSRVAAEPSLALLHQPNIWWQQYKLWRYYSDVGGRTWECVVGPHAELVLDGFQGSGNSFASEAIQRSQTGRRLRLVHHLHSPAQIIKAVEMNLPTIVTIREPEGAVLSLVSRWPYVSLQQALSSYIRFYEKIEPYAHGYVLSPFESTTQHLDEIVRAVNERFDTKFNAFEYTEANMRVLRDPKDLQSDEERERKALKAKMRRELSSEKHRRKLARANALHGRLEPLGVSG